MLQTSLAQSPSRKFIKLFLNLITNSTTIISHSYTMELRRGLFNKIFHFHWAFSSSCHPEMISSYGSYIFNKKIPCKHLLFVLQICTYAIVKPSGQNKGKQNSDSQYFEEYFPHLTDHEYTHRNWKIPSDCTQRELKGKCCFLEMLFGFGFLVGSGFLLLV